MELPNIDIKSLKFKEIKEIVDTINIEEKANSEELNEIIKILLNDSRKNVTSLGNKLERAKNKTLEEFDRVKAMYEFDKSFGDYHIIAGVDEVGRGPLAGPIVSCAVILDNRDINNNIILGLNDSKKIPQKKREELAEIIKEKALAYYIAVSSNEEIDSKGIAYSNNKVFLEACTSLKVKPDLVLSDGYLVKNLNIDNKHVIKGDTKSAAIAAASIVAKVYRDNLMAQYSKEYPGYYFEENSGYGTTKHIEGIKKLGPCKIHRMSFLKNIL